MTALPASVSNRIAHQTDSTMKPPNLAMMISKMMIQTVWIMINLDEPRLGTRFCDGRYTHWFHNDEFWPYGVVTVITRFIGPTWGRQAPGGAHVGPMNLAIWITYFSVKRYGCQLKQTNNGIASNLSSPSGRQQLIYVVTQFVGKNHLNHTNSVLLHNAQILMRLFSCMVYISKQTVFW